MEPELKPHEARPSVALARDWFDRFGGDTTVISPMGRRLFRWLLELAENGSRGPTFRPRRQTQTEVVTTD